MARDMSGEETEIYRAVIVKTYPGESQLSPEPREFVEFAGPFVGKRQASAAITRVKDREVRYRQWGSGYPKATITGYVEKASVVWERVTEEPK